MIRLDRQGFTTIEAAIVALIIGILAAACPSFNGEMAWGFLVIGLTPLVGKLLRRSNVPLAACVLASLTLAAYGLASLRRGVQTAPGFGRAIPRSHEATAKASLTQLRAVLEKYKKEKGSYPEDLGTIGSIPPVRTPPSYSASAAIQAGKQSDGSGGWLYDNIKGSRSFGRVWVNCTATDSEGKTWNAY